MMTSCPPVVAPPCLRTLFGFTLSVAFLLSLASTGLCSSYEDRELFRDDEAGFEVAYPKTWEENPLQQKKRFAIRNSDTQKLGVISVSVARAKNDVADPDKYMAFCREKLPSILVKGMEDRMGNGELIEHADLQLSGHPAHRFTMTYDVNQPTGSITLISSQVHCVKDGKLYILNFETPFVTFDENYSAFESVLSTFNFR
jgi:hypothetical protein